ncbi:cholecystokinin receptor type A-like [Mizuhopecten yessoensis]|uniref:Gastrin/cholecystokinin type B receptor n=1 Tax=Mizuhopecten yessoensis TaxID=6573 RepID=A0A210R0K7_MIZYE|nr:cholecystokinin receptor type A-like [Mizuhopecten yessoensis]OWF54492.1 Cholecystokinin receptor type A [Mizuhopecten yessoensis]
MATDIGNISDMLSDAPLLLIKVKQLTLWNVTQSFDNISGWENSTINGSFANMTVDPVLERFLPWSPPTLNWLWILLIPLYIQIFILAVLGNALVILTLIQNKRMRTVTNVFLLNLSVSDLLLAVFCMPFTIVPMMLKNFIFGETMCYLIRYLQGVSVATSCFTLVAIALERYFAICRPLHSRKWQTLSHSYKTIAICWALSFFVMIPIPVYTEFRHLKRGNNMCIERWGNEEWKRAYTIIIDLVLLILPVIIMSSAYGMIAMTLWVGMKRDAQSEKEAMNGHTSVREETTGFMKDEDLSPVSEGFSSKTVAPAESYSSRAKSKRRFDLQRGMRQSNSEKSRAAKRRVIKMLFAVVYEFFLCWTPLYIIQSWIILDEEHAMQHISMTLLAFINLTAYISSCCNPITYCFMNRNFRQGFLSVFRCVRNKRWKRGKSDMSYSGNYPSMSRTAISTVPSYDKIHDSSDKPSDDI